MARRRLWAGVAIALGLVGLWALLVYPALEQDAQRAPLTRMLAALGDGDVPDVRAQFTEDGGVRLGLAVLPIDAVLRAVAPVIEQEARGTRMRFDGFRTPVRAGDRIAADFWVWIYVGRPDDPSREVPLHKSGHVVLEKQGFLRWKIVEISSAEVEFDEIMQRMEILE